MTPSDRLEALTRNRWLEWLLGPERKPDAPRRVPEPVPPIWEALIRPDLDVGRCPGADFGRYCPNSEHPFECGPRGHYVRRYFTDWRPERTPEAGRWVRYECEVPVISRSVFDPPRRRTVEGWAWARYAPAPDESATDHDAEPRGR